MRKAHIDSFPSDVAALQSEKGLPSASKLLSLVPKLDLDFEELEDCSGELRILTLKPYIQHHTIVFDSSHPVEKLLIQEYDDKLLHPGPEQLFAELQQRY